MAIESILPADINVVVPANVRKASELAAALHQQAYAPGAEQQPQSTETGADPQSQPVQTGADPHPQPTPPAAQPEPQPPQPPSQPQPVEAGEPNWEHRYLSMKGRYDQAQATIGGMQEQVATLGSELVQLQRAFQNRPAAPPPQPPQPRITDDDVKNYGNDIIDLTRRAALDAVAPELDALRKQNANLLQRVAQTTQTTVYDTIERAIPNWRDINVSPSFKAWCALRDVYSGQLRGQMLNAAIRAADAPRAIAFFKGFLDEETATGQVPKPPSPVATDARQPAVQLATLVSPGRDRPAPGNSPASPADKPSFTRPQIAKFYADVRKGVYSGRDEERTAHELAIFAAQREGRVR